MASKPIWQWSAVETARATRTGEVSCEAVAHAHIARLRIANPPLNAVVVDLSDQALGAARALDQARARGEALGDLHGVPVTIKINIDVEGQANSNGAVALAGNIAPGDAPVTANLRKAGAVILGLTNTPEYSFRLCTDNALHGLTLNPWDPAITAGGSSGGAGASVAAGIGCLAHGNDIGGSLRWPAHCNGVATIKPTLGRVPAFNPSAPAERPLMAQLMSVQGPLAREVADVRLGLEVMARRDMRDPWWVPAPLAAAGAGGPCKVAVARVPADMEPDPDVMAMIDQAAGWLADAGYEVIRDVEVPDLAGTWRLWAQLLTTEIATLQAAQMLAGASPDFERALDGMLRMATVLDAEGYMRAVASRAGRLRDWLALLETWPILLAPESVKRALPVNGDLADDDAVRRILGDHLRFSSALSVLGLPIAVTPIGLLDGHPMGVQLIGSRYEEGACLDAAAVIEARVGVLSHALWAREAAL